MSQGPWVILKTIDFDLDFVQIEPDIEKHSLKGQE
jgi:hypothetical protein